MRINSHNFDKNKINTENTNIVNEIINKIKVKNTIPQIVKFRFIMSFDYLNVEYDYSLN